eukprot:5783271-Amphidinium_carterae.3
MAAAGYRHTEPPSSAVLEDGEGGQVTQVTVLHLHIPGCVEVIVDLGNGELLFHAVRGPILPGD